MTAKEHNKLLSIFFFVLAGLQLIGGILMAIIYVVLGGSFMSVGHMEEQRVMGGVFVVVGIVIGAIMIGLGGFTLLTATKVLKEKPAGRTLGIIVSILVLLSFPIGTALGIYGLWFFFGEMGKNFYGGLSSGNWKHTPPQPPSPSSWQ
jgi:hypothetical protein